jgi:putative RecB family exonuclease
MLTLSEMRSELSRYWSQSRIGQFQMCSLKYAFSYVYKLKPEFTPVALSFGSAVHRTLEAMAHARKDGEPMNLADSQELFAEIWLRQLQEDQDIRYPEGESAESLQETGLGIITVFHANTDPAEQVVAISQALAVPVITPDGRVLDDPLICELDLVVRDREGELVITDWKTSAQRWSKRKADTEIQPTAFCYAYYQQYGVIPKFRYDIAVKTKTPAFQQEHTTRSVEDFARLGWLVESVEKAVKAEAFVPQPGFVCASCQYQQACSVAHQRLGQSVRLAA